MKEETLFELPAIEEKRVPGPTSPPTSPREARVLRPVRNQLGWAAVDLESLLPQEHQARVIWSLLEKLDLSAFYAPVKAVENGPGRPTTDPKALLALWLLATVDGIGSARRLGRMCEEHDAYRWMRGNVPVNYHMLSDFRVDHQAALDSLLTEIIASLMAAGAVRLDRVAQDGMRVRASAGAASFRGEEGLKRCLERAQAQVEQLAREREHPDPGVTRRERAARERAAREREERVREALAYLPQAQAKKERRKKKEGPKKEGQLSAKAVEQRPADQPPADQPPADQPPADQPPTEQPPTEQPPKATKARVSTTAPEVRVMKMPDGGFRPACNVELATDCANGIIVGVAVVAAGSDAGQAAPMEEQLVRRTGRHPGLYLMDGGFATLDDIATLEQREVSVYAPVRLPRNKPEGERYEPRDGDKPEVARWRKRMASDEAKAIYRQRGAVAEWANAQVRLHGVSQFNVRGLAKITSVMLLVALAHNLLRWAAFTS